MKKRVTIKDYTEIKEIAKINGYYDFNAFSKRKGSSMKDFCGKTVTIDNQYDNKIYKILEDGGAWFWKEWMFYKEKLELDLE